MAMVTSCCSWLVFVLVALLIHVQLQAEARARSLKAFSSKYNIVAASFPYSSQAAPSKLYKHPAAPPPQQHKRPLHHSQRAVVTGHVYCDTCRNGHLKEPLKGVTIGVICWNGEVEQSFYGTTNKLGNFKIKLSGYDLRKGVKSCRAKLIYSAFNTVCTLPTNLHDGKLGAKLHMKSKTTKNLVLLAGPFAYTTPSKNKKCHHKGGRSISSHKHKYTTSPSHSHTHSQLQAKNKSPPSCPVYDCKTTPSHTNNPNVALLMTQRKIATPKAISPVTHSFKQLSSPIFKKNKYPNPHRNNQ